MISLKKKIMFNLNTTITHIIGRISSKSDLVLVKELMYSF
jgi:hypothetical protein